MRRVEPVDQLKDFAEPGDVVIAFIESGNSPNVILAVGRESARIAETVVTEVYKPMSETNSVCCGGAGCLGIPASKSASVLG